MVLEIQISDQDLPVLSAIATEALEMIQNPNVSNKQIDELIRQDMSLTARLMRTANSPFYGGRRQTTTISDAIFRLGLRQLRNVLIVAATGELFNDGDPIIRALWDHGLMTAMTAQTLADTFEIAHKEEAFIAGMLHDIGVLIIYRQHPETYRDLMREAKECGRPLHEMEAERFKYFTHMSVGGLVIRKWRLADSVAESARFHHDLEKMVPSAITCKHLACTVATADTMINQITTDSTQLDLEKVEAMASAQFLHLSKERLALLAPRIEQYLGFQRTPPRE